MIAADLTGLVLSALLAEDALTARELSTVLGCTTAALRPALRHLVDAGAVATSGRTSGTRYCLALEEQPVAPPSAFVRRYGRSYPSRPAATLDLYGALVATAEQLLAGRTLAQLAAVRP